MKDYREVVGTDCHGLSYRQVMDIVELVRPYTSTDFAQTFNGTESNSSFCDSR